MTRLRLHPLRNVMPWILVAIATAPGLARGQTQYKAMAPEVLVQAWPGATRPDRTLIEDALVERRATSLPALRQSARAGAVAEKLFACALLAEMRDQGSTATLLTATTDSDARVRARAVSALRIVGDRSAASRMRQLVRGEKSGPVLKVSLAALGELGTSRDAGLVRPLLSHPSEDVRVMAAGALAMLGDQGGQEIVLAATRSADPWVQKQATFALGYLGTPEATARVHEILDDPSGQWKSYAVMALALQELRAQFPQEQVVTLDSVARGQDGLAADWALDRLVDLASAEATQELATLTGQPGELGRQAARRLKAIAGR